MFSYDASAGTAAYNGAAIASMSGGVNTGLKFGSTTLQSVSLGGAFSSNGIGAPWSGLEIEEVALFVGGYWAASSLNEYEFPTLNIDSTASMTMTELNAKVAAFDSTKFNYFSASPVVTLDVEPDTATVTYLQSDSWNGTVLIEDADKTGIVPTKYGNPNSTLKLSGVKGYFEKAQYTADVTPAIELENSDTEGREYGLYLNNGYSFDSNGGYAYVNTPELKGSGLFKADGSANKVLWVVNKWSSFTGTLNLTNKAVWFGTGIPAQTTDGTASITAGSVRLATTIPASVGDGCERLRRNRYDDDGGKHDRGSFPYGVSVEGYLPDQYAEPQRPVRHCQLRQRQFGG